MNKIKFVVSVSGNQLTLDVLERISDRSFSGTLRGWLDHAQGREASQYRRLETMVFQGSTSGNGLAILLKSALEQLSTRTQYDLATTQLEVDLGPALSRVGVLQMEESGPSSFFAEDMDAYAETWVSQTWKLQPRNCVLRSVPIGGQGRHLITCIERHIIDALQTLCVQASIRMTRCTPVLAAYLASQTGQANLSGFENDKSQRDSAALHLGVFVERELGGRRSRLAQFVVSDQVGPKSVIRMWLAEGNGQAGDVAIDQVMARLLAQYRVPAFSRVDLTLWPIAVN